MSGFLLCEKQLDQYIGGIVRVLSSRYGNELSGLRGWIERLLAKKGTKELKMCVFFVVLNRSRAMQTFFLSKVPKSKWESFQPVLARHTNDLYDGRVGINGYVSLSQSAWIIS